MRQNLDITEVEAATKIRAKYLRALENDEFSMIHGSTYVKSFLRTYAEFLGLDAQLLVEEFRAQHEPRGESEQAIGPPARARPVRDRRAGIGGSPVGPGGALLLAIGLILLLLAVIGLASGGDEDGDQGGSRKADSEERRERQRRERARDRREAAANQRERSSVKLKVVPSQATYMCLDDGQGTKLFEGTISSPQSFRERRRIRINLGLGTAALYVNGERYRYPRTADSVGFEFTRNGDAKKLALGDRPCA